MDKPSITILACMLMLGLTGCAGSTAPTSPPDAQTSGNAGAAVQPTALEDCVTAVGADRTQCRAK